MEPKTDLIMVLPIHNPNIANWECDLQAAFKKIFSLFKNIDLKILLVNDGSCVDLSEGFNNLKLNFPDVEMLSYKKNRGKGFAVRTGLAAGCAKHYIYTDWDFPFGEQSVYETYTMLRDTKADLIVGTRCKAYYDKLPFGRKVISKGLKIANYFLLGFKSIDTQAGIKGLSNNARLLFLKTKTDGFVFELEFIQMCVRKKLKISKLGVIPKQELLFNNFRLKTVLKEVGYFFKLVFPKRDVAIKNKILLTFDLEEFDLPLEYNTEISKQSQLDITTTGLKNLIPILKRNNITATFFTTAYYAENNVSLIQELIKDGHEIASHFYYHSDYCPSHILKSKQKLEEITNQQITGIRIPRLKEMDINLIKDAGYLYNSSLNPTYLPGRYNNYFKPRVLSRDLTTNLFILPFSVTPIVRFPLFWLTFKNINLQLFVFLCRQTLRKDKYLHLYFHPWEFTDLSAFEIPAYIKNKSGKRMHDRLDSFIKLLQLKGNFVTINQFLLKKEDSKITISNKDTKDEALRTMVPSNG